MNGRQPPDRIVYDIRPSESSPIAATAPDAESIWIPLAGIASCMVAIITVVTSLAFPGAPRAMTVAVGVAGPFLGVSVAKTIGATLHWFLARN